MHPKRLSTYLAAASIAAAGGLAGAAHAASGAGGFTYDSVATQIQREADGAPGTEVRTPAARESVGGAYDSVAQRVRREAPERAGQAETESGGETLARTPGFEPTKSVRQRVREDQIN